MNPTTSVRLPRVRTPWYRRITAVLGLGSIVIILGVALAITLASLAFGLLFVLERAVG